MQINKKKKKSFCLGLFIYFSSSSFLSTAATAASAAWLLHLVANFFLSVRFLSPRWLSVLLRSSSAFVLLIKSRRFLGSGRHLPTRGRHLSIRRRLVTIGGFVAPKGPGTNSRQPPLAVRARSTDRGHGGWAAERCSRIFRPAYTADAASSHIQQEG
eukprot:GHVT01025996.1.p2 GENE.GHVT01025996.1~~GHVT01025996.1.p2  ORF type:complete len:157 (-),score=21.05 GHVT01025996.1:1015-1485(-)